MTGMNDLISQVERDNRLRSRADKVRACLSAIPAEQHAAALRALIGLHLALREMSRHWGDDLARAESKSGEIESRLMDLRLMNEQSVGATEAARRVGMHSVSALQKFLIRHEEGQLWSSLLERDPNADLTPKPPKSRLPIVGSSHASQKVAIATRSWNELLETHITLPGMPHKTAIADMTSEQLHDLGDSLFDTSEQVNRLAEAIDAAGVETARDLEPRALEACMAEEAA